MGRTDLRCRRADHPRASPTSSSIMPASARPSRSKARRCRFGRSRSRSARRSTTAGAATSAAGRARCSPAWSARSKCPAERSARRCGSTGRRTIAGRASSPVPTASWIIPMNPTGQGRLDFAPARAQRPPHAGAAGRQFAVEPGARADPSRLDDAGRTTSTHLPAASPPDVWFVYRTNPAISFWDTKAVSDAMAQFPFTVCFAYTHDETNHMADVLLPDCTDLEGLQLLRIGGTKYVEQFWDHQGFALRDPVGAAAGRGQGLHLDRDRAGRAAPACSKPITPRSIAARPACALGSRLRLFARSGSAARRRDHLGCRLSRGERRDSPTAPNRRAWPTSANTASG